MKIQMNDGRVIEGTPVQIVTDMQSLAFGQDDKTLTEYMAWAAAQLERFGGPKLQIQGETQEERAASFVAGMLAHGLAREEK